MKATEVEKLIKKAGWELSRQTGSHRIYRHSARVGEIVVIPWHNKDLAPGTLHNIFKQAGITKPES